MVTGYKRLRVVFSLSALIAVIAACGSPAVVEPPADAYPATVAPRPTATLPPYPWPTQTPPPTDRPEPTEEPTETVPPDPTQPPTPVVTPIPTAAPPIIPLPEGATAQPFSLFWRDGDVILTMRSEGEMKPAVFLDPVKEFGLYLTPREIDVRFRSWGAISPGGQTFALILTEEANPQMSYGAPYPTHINLFDVESRALRPLVKYGAEPVWSPDGKRLAYISTETGGVWVVDVAGGKTTEVYEVDRANEHSVAISGVAWSPDNRYLAIVDQVINQSTALMLVDVEGIEPLRVLIEHTLYILGGPQWLPRPGSIVFGWTAGEGGRGPHLWVIDPVSGERKQITDSINVLFTPVPWPLGGDRIVFSGPASHEREFSGYDIWVADLSSFEIKRITHGNADVPKADLGIDVLLPLWTPDGTQLVFVKVPMQDELAEVWVLSLADGSERKLVDIMTVFDDGLLVGP